MLVVSALALTGLGAGYLTATRVLFPAPPPPGDLYEVPDVLGVDVQAARDRIDGAGLVLGEARLLRHPEADSGTVVGQSPLPGQLARPEDPVRVTVSLGPERRTVPDVLRLRSDWARSLLEASGFTVVVDSAEAEEPRGTVLALEPEPGTELTVPGEVVLRVSQGPPLVPMPRVLGMTEEEALDTLRALGLPVRDVNEVFRFGRDQGRVVEQAPPADSLLPRGTPVRLSVGRRPGVDGAARDTLGPGGRVVGVDRETPEATAGSEGNKDPRQP